MSSDPHNHWSATAYRLMIGPVPAAVAIPIPILPFWHPTWLVLLSIAWAVVVTWLANKGMGLGGLLVLLRRWLQGNRLTQRRKR